MVFCTDCFCDIEIKAAIEICSHKGDCPVCGKKDTWIYDSDIDSDKTNVEELIKSIIEIYKPESELPSYYPEKETC